MKIAITGSHNTGKTTLVSKVHALLPKFSIVEEPYDLLSEEGHVFSAFPSIDDFELQLTLSIASVKEGNGDTIFDRCPLDILAYLNVHEESGFEIEPWLPRVRESVQMLDFVVFVSIEDPDIIGLDDSEDVEFRQRVNEELQEIVLGDKYDLGMRVIEVFGSTEERAKQVTKNMF